MIGGYSRPIKLIKGKSVLSKLENHYFVEKIAERLKSRDTIISIILH